jgi:CBS domain containing-hemolysin-like protein
MYIAFRPIIWVMNHASNGLLWICGQGDIIGGGDGHGHGAAMSEEELRTVIAASAHSHNIPRDTARIINGAFDLSGDKVRSIMVPRVDVKALHETQTFAEALKMFKETNHKRFPVHSGELDNIVGVVSIKSMIHAIEVDPTKAEAVMQTPLKAIMHAPFVVPSNSHISDLLAQFKQQRRQIAIAVNEYGGMEGIITLEDILSDLIGEVQDEFAPHSRKVKKLEGSQWLIDATMRVGDLEPIVNYPFPLNPEYTTLGGLAYTKLGHIPQVGDTVDMDAGRLEVVEMDGHRVTKVKFTDLAVGADGKLQLADAHSAAESDD